MEEISIHEAEYVVHSFAQETFAWNEPIPPFETRYPDRLESCLATPFQEYDGKKLYDGLNKQAAVLFYLMIKIIRLKMAINALR